VGNAEYVYLREGRSRHKSDPKNTGPFKVDRRHGTVVWIWRNGRLEPHKLDRVIAAGQLDLGDASERSSSDSEVALHSHESLDTPGGTRDTDGGMILLCIRSSDGKKGSFDVKGLPYAS